MKKKGNGKERKKLYKKIPKKENCRRGWKLIFVPGSGKRNVSPPVGLQASERGGNKIDNKKNWGG